MIFNKIMVIRMLWVMIITIKFIIMVMIVQMRILMKRIDDGSSKATPSLSGFCGI